MFQIKKNLPTLRCIPKTMYIYITLAPLQFLFVSKIGPTLQLTLKITYVKNTYFDLTEVGMEK